MRAASRTSRKALPETWGFWLARWGRDALALYILGFLISLVSPHVYFQECLVTGCYMESVKETRFLCRFRASVILQDYLWRVCAGRTYGEGHCCCVKGCRRQASFCLISVNRVICNMLAHSCRFTVL